jgi:hypothetical protein
MTTDEQNREKPKIKLFDPMDPGVDPILDLSLEQVYQEYHMHNIEQRKAGEKADEVTMFKCRQITKGILEIVDYLANELNTNRSNFLLCISPKALAELNYFPEVRSIRAIHQRALETVIRQGGYDQYAVSAHEYNVMNRANTPRACFKTYAWVYSALSDMARSCGLETTRIYMAGLTLSMIRSELAYDLLKDTVAGIFNPEIDQFKKLLNGRLAVLNEQIARGQK